MPAAHAFLAVTVHCRGCGYNLKGLPLEGRCPECGLFVTTTVQALVDPQASQLPRLRNPRAVGNGVLGLVSCALISVMLLVAGPGLELATQGRFAFTLGPVAVPRDLLLLAAVVAAIGFWPIIVLLPPRGAEARDVVRRDLWLVSVGLGGWSILLGGLYWHERSLPAWLVRAEPSTAVATVHLALVMCGVAVLLGLSGLLRTVGQRSRAYRSAHAARQGVHAMIGAAAGIAVGEIARLSPTRFGLPPVTATMGAVVLWVCIVMLVIGLMYMFVNAWWIRTALLRPPPTLDELMLPARVERVELPEEG